jgi:hypothetical protein
MSYKVLGQVAPSANTDTTLYTVPSSKQTVASTLAICNREASTAITYRVAIRPAGAAIAVQHYIVYEATLPAGQSHFLTLGITLDTTDVVTVRASTANTSFNLFGSEA